MARPKTIISKAELADVLGLSRGRISQLSKREDFPLRTDGRVNRDDAVRWYRDAGLGQQMNKRGPKPRVRVTPAAKPPKPPAAEDVPPEIDYGVRSVFEALIAGSGRVPEILCELGVRDQVALAVSAELFCDLVFALAWELTDHGYEWAGNDDRSETPVVNMRKLAKKYGFKFDPAAVRMDFKAGRKRSAAELLIDKSDALLYPPLNAA